MKSRERVRMALNHQQPDRVPLQLWLTGEVAASLKSHFNLDNSEEDLLDALDIDVRWLLVDYIGPEFEVFPDSSRDTEFGVRLRPAGNRFGSYDEISFHPLAEAQNPSDVENHRWPDPDWWDYSSIVEKIDLADRVEPRWLGIGYASLFERAWGLTGLEKWFYDIAMNPDLVDAVIDRLLRFYLEQTSRILEASNGRIDMVYIADDLGGQNGLLISPAMWQRYLKGPWKTFIDTIRERFGRHLRFHFHSCGSVLDLVPEFVEIGIDILNPIQPKAAGMAPGHLKKVFGDRLCFSGGLDIQELLPHGSRQEVRDEAIRLTRILGEEGGYIACPAHAVQPDTSVENVLAMMEGFKQA